MNGYFDLSPGVLIGYFDILILDPNDGIYIFGVLSVLIYMSWSFFPEGV
jgi:hypothetical protein